MERILADISKVLIPPNSKESEMMVLGSMLTSVNSLNVAADALDSLDFYYTEHQIIFDILKTAYKNDKPADVHLVCEELKRQGKLKAVGGAAYVTSVAQYAGTSAFIEEYAEVVQNKAILRRMIHTAHDIEKSAAADPSDVHALLDDAQQKLFVISQSTNPQGGLLVRDILSGVKATAKIPFLKELQQRQEDFKLKGPEDPGITGLPTHFLDLDKMINGLGKSNFIILAARPAMGKCVTGNTQIIDPITGALRCIKDLVTQGSGHVATLGKDWTLQTATPSAFVADGIKPTFKLTTALGREIEATAVHPLLTINGWKRLENLKIGERIATPRTLPYFGKKEWPEHELIALADLITGKYSANKSSHKSLSIKQKFENTIQTLIKNLSFSNSQALATPMPYQSTTLALQEDFFESPSISATAKNNLEMDPKVLPQGIFELTKNNIATLLNRLFSCDGTYTSESKTLIHQLQHLLLRFGILSKITSEKNRPSFKLKVHGKKSFALFSQQIGMLDKEGTLSKTAQSDVYWDKIISIEPTGEKEVFDLTVDQTHNFVAGDIIVHNTAFAVNIAENLCFKSGIPVGIFSLEMTAEQLLHRLICSQSEVESDKLRTGNLNGAEFQRIVAAVNSMQKSTMVIDDQPGLKITDLRARARRMKETHGIQFLVIDYLQLISGSGVSKSAENRQNEISEISRLLKNLARELNIPIVCLSQLSRKVEERPGHRPMMSDLRESGCLSGDALIQDANTGKFHTIKELSNRKEQEPIFVHAINKDLKIGKHRMVKAFYSGQKIIYELKTRTGRSIKASGNHPFLKLNGWTPLEQLKAGDKIGLSQKEILDLAESDVYWDEILSIKELGVEDVYDATVENVHNFVANDIIVHNSLEQDSDAVIFLLRREYYDPYDKPGLAEVIVAKNRHGGVGSVFLTFRKELAQFANYSGSLESASSGAPKDDAFSAFTPR